MRCSSTWDTVFGSQIVSSKGDKISSDSLQRSSNIMDSIQWYGVFCAGLMMLPFSLWAAKASQSIVRDHQRSSPKYLCYSHGITRIEAILVITAAIVNGVVLGHSSSAETLARRAGLLASINFIFLSFGHHISHLSRSWGLSAADCGRVHHWSAAIAFLEILVHSATALVLKLDTPGAGSQVWSWVVSLRFCS